MKENANELSGASVGQGPPPVLRSFYGVLGRLLPGREIWAVADQAIVSGSNFFTNIALARMIGIEAFGAFVLAWMVTLFANLFQTALIISPMMSVGPTIETAERPKYLGVMLLHEAALVGLVSLLIVLLCPTAAFVFHRPEIRTVSFSLSAATGCYLTQDFLRRYLFLASKPKPAFWLDALSYIPQVPLIAAAAKLTHLSTNGALWIVAGTSFAGLLAAFTQIGPASFDKPMIRRITTEHWKLSRWLTLSVCLDWAQANLFLLAAPIYFGVAAAGVIRATSNIVGIAHIWFLGLGNVIPAETARQLHTKDLPSAIAYLQHTIVRWGSITSLFVLIITVKPGRLLGVVYGARYEEYGYLLRLYGILYLLVFVAIPIRAMLQALQDTAPIFWSSLILSIFALITSLPLVHFLGLSGVVMGSILSQITGLVFLGIALDRRISRVPATVVLDSDLRV